MSMLLPLQFSAAAWGIALISFVTALIWAIIDQRRHTVERPDVVRR